MTIARVHRMQCSSLFCSTVRKSLALRKIIETDSLPKTRENALPLRGFPCTLLSCAPTYAGDTILSVQGPKRCLRETYGVPLRVA